MTEQQKIESRKNNRKTRKILNVPKGYVLHHINTEWKTTDIDRYIKWNVDDVVVLSASEHRKLHATGSHLSDETKLKISMSSIGKVMSEESKRKNSESHKGTISTKGKSWFNNGIVQTLSFVCPDGFVKGRLTNS